MKICVFAVEGGLRKKETEDETQFSLPPKSAGTTSLGLSCFFICKIFIPSYAFDALL